MDAQGKCILLDEAANQSITKLLDAAAAALAAACPGLTQGLPKQSALVLCMAVTRLGGTDTLPEDKWPPPPEVNVEIGSPLYQAFLEEAVQAAQHDRLALIISQRPSAYCAALEAAARTLAADDAAVVADTSQLASYTEKVAAAVMRLQTAFKGNCRLPTSQEPLSLLLTLAKAASSCLAKHPKTTESALTAAICIMEVCQATLRYRPVSSTVQGPTAADSAAATSTTASSGINMTSSSSSSSSSSNDAACKDAARVRSPEPWLALFGRATAAAGQALHTMASLKGSKLVEVADACLSGIYSCKLALSGLTKYLQLPVRSDAEAPSTAGSEKVLSGDAQAALEEWTQLTLAVKEVLQHLEQQLLQEVCAVQESLQDTLDVLTQPDQDGQAIAAALTDAAGQLLRVARCTGAQVPLPLGYCHNPGCTNLSGPVELQVSASGGCCKPCRSVKYCSAKCQKAHWKDHRALCEVLSKARELQQFYQKDKQHRQQVARRMRQELQHKQETVQQWEEKNRQLWEIARELLEHKHALQVVSQAREEVTQMFSDVERMQQRIKEAQQEGAGPEEVKRLIQQMKQAYDKAREQSQLLDFMQEIVDKRQQQLATLKADNKS